MMTTQESTRQLLVHVEFVKNKLKAPLERRKILMNCTTESKTFWQSWMNLSQANNMVLETA